MPSKKAAIEGENATRLASPPANPGQLDAESLDLTEHSPKLISETEEPQPELNSPVQTWSADVQNKNECSTRPPADPGLENVEDPPLDDNDLELEIKPVSWSTSDWLPSINLKNGREEDSKEDESLERAALQLHQMQEFEPLSVAKSVSPSSSPISETQVCWAAGTASAEVLGNES